MKRYVLYQSKVENSYDFFEEGSVRNMELLEKDAELIWSVEADSFEIAIMKQHEYLGWDPYKPVVTNEKDLKRYIPKNKFDVDNAQLLINLGYPTIKPVLMDLFEWIQDMNWPVARIVGPFLATIGKDCISEIKTILRSDDIIWKYWVLLEVVDKFSTEDLHDLKQELSKLSLNPTDEERLEEVDKLSQSILSKIN